MIKLDNNIINASSFPDGTSAFRTDVPDKDEITVTWCFDSNDEMALLFYLVNHIRSHNSDADLILQMPYIPNARMDRVKNPDEVFTLKYFASFINSFGFKKVIVYDPHSNVSEALINNISVESHEVFIKDVMEKTNFNEENDVLFYPDAGCAKKYENIFKLPYLKGEKKRDWRSGKIERLELIGTIPQNGFNVLIIDDICSRGGTFFYAAKSLKQAGAREINLYVTHCENTILEGEMIKSCLIKKIYTTDSIFTATDNKIEIIKKFR